MWFPRTIGGWLRTNIENRGVRRTRQRRARATVERLEVRALLSTVTVGLPTWTDLGSKPMISAGSTSAPNNPASGAVEAVAVDPNNPAHIFLGTVNGGIWRTTNGNRPFNGVDDDGVNGVDDPLEQPDWVPLTDDFRSLAIGDIQFSPLDPTGNTLFAGTGSASSLGGSGGLPIGILSTTDGGNSWTVTALNPGGADPRVRAILPTTFDASPAAGVQQAILVGTTGGLFRSADGGQTYTLISGTNGLALGSVTEVIADPNNASRFFAGVVGQGVFRSDDGGLNWTPVNTNLTNLVGSTVIQLSAHPGGGTTVLHVLISGPNPVVFTSNDGGNNWTGLAALPAAWTSNNNGLYTTLASDQLVADPTDSQIVYLSKGYGGGLFLVRYDPSGAGSWVQINGAGFAQGNTQPHVDNRDLDFVGNNVLISANDGGIYFIRNPQDALNNSWTSLHGRGANGLGATEYTNIAWDSRFNVAVGGAQDNGTTVQTAAGDPVWTLFHGADGGDVAIETINAGAGNSFRYASSQNFGSGFTTPFAGGLTRHTFDAASNQIAAVDLITVAGLAGFNAPFVPNYELNVIGLSRLVVGGTGGSPVYELTNASTTPDAASATWVAVPVGAGFGNVTGGFAVGGRLGGVDNPEVLVVGSGLVFIRSTAGGTLTATPTPFPGVTVQDIVLDPENWQHFFVTDGTGVWETPDAGTTWNNLTRNLAAVNARIQTIEFIPSVSGGTVVVGGDRGVSRLVDCDSPLAQWTRFGLELPNASTRDLDFNATDDILLAGTFGRGAWSIPNVSTIVEQGAGLLVFGDDLFSGQDDEFLVTLNAANNLLLDVFVNGVLEFQGALAAIEFINIFGFGGDDTLTVDSSNGLISVCDEISFDGGDGFDDIVLSQTGGATQFTHTYSVGPNTGEGSSVIVGPSGTQTILFENLEPVLDLVPALSLIVNATPANNAINLSQGGVPANGLITIDNFERIEFSNKTNLTINAGAGRDEVNIANIAAPTGLITIFVNGNEADDIIKSLAAINSVFNGGDGDDLLSSGAGDDFLNGGVGNDILTGNAGVDEISGDAGVDLVLENRNANFTLTETSLVVGAEGIDTLDSIEQAHLRGGAGDNAFDIGAFTGKTTLYGGAGSDTTSFLAAAQAIAFDMDALGVAQMVNSLGRVVVLEDILENLIATLFNDILFADIAQFDRLINGSLETAIPPGDRLTVDLLGSNATVVKNPNGGKAGSFNGTINGNGFTGTINFLDIETLKLDNQGAIPVDFTAATDYLVGDGPRGVQTGDVDGDGILDLISANSRSDTVGIRLGNGFGLFGPLTSFLAGGKETTTAALGDVDNDGDLDIVVANRKSRNIGVLLNDGTGNFATAAFSTGTNQTGKQPASVKLGDFDGDGNLDAATANGGSGTVSVLLGDGAGGFGPAATFLTGGKFPRDLVIGDFNTDGNDDVVVTNRKSSNVAFLAGDGTGALAAPVLFETGAQPTSITTGDFNGDGIIDLAVTCQTTKDISILLGTGLLVGPQFEEQLRIHYPNVRLEISIATGDLDGDGNDDLVIANRISNTLSYMLGVGNGTFNERVDFKSGDIRFREPVAIALGDFNADGALDVMVANAGTDDVSVLLRVPIV